MTEVLAEDDARVAERVADALRAGGVVVLPTDTVYGVAALPADAAAVERLFSLKGRRHDVPIAVLCADAEQALALAEPAAAERARAAAARWWPGPLTLVLPRRAGLHLHLGQPDHTVGLRVPDHPLVQAVARLVGPVATTSANRHGQPVAVTAEEAVAALGDGVDLAVAGPRLEGRSSTVVDATPTPWRVLRDGPVPGAEVVALERP
ncbi:MAG TPA: L-threonylcarbamoyladenylate synthase [Acidimicrobiales bacterium]|nr:L-threonylcarbamoyladenylate synthase [Acidimicrobiales bacterium]